MSEYIVDVDASRASEKIRIREKIVRCRDCRSFMDVTESCSRHAVDLGDLGIDVTTYPEVNAEGFCSWGVAR